MRYVAVGMTLKLFSEHLLKRLFVEGEIGHESLQSAILVFTLAQSIKLCGVLAAKLPLPKIEGCLSDTELLALLRYRGAVVDLFDRKCNLFITECRSRTRTHLMSRSTS